MIIWKQQYATMCGETQTKGQHNGERDDQRWVFWRTLFWTKPKIKFEWHFDYSWNVNEVWSMLLNLNCFFVELHVGIYNASAGLQRFDFGELWEMLCKRRVAIEEVRKNCGRSTYKLYIYTMIISHNYI